MARNSHNMAIFPHFLAFFVTVFGLVTTFMNALGIARTQTLVTHVGWWYGVIFGLWLYLSGLGVFYEPYHPPMHGKT